MDHRIQQLHHHALLPRTKKVINTTKEITSFKDVLSDAIQLKLSKHAKERLTERNISINEAQWEKISRKVVEAKQKGITDSLVVTGEAALLVSTKNNTVVTAMDRKEASSKIFTNINGTILVD